MSETQTAKTLEWRTELDQALQLREEAERAAAQAKRAEEIQRRNQYIDAVIDLAKFLGIEGELLEREHKEEEQRPIPHILLDGYRFAFRQSDFKGEVPGAPRTTVVTAENKHLIAYFRLEVRKDVVGSSDCWVRNCQYTHVVKQVLSNNLTRVDLTTGEGLAEFKIELAKTLRKLDETAEQQRVWHQESLVKLLANAEERAYDEKARREWVQPEEPEEPDDTEISYEPVELPALPKPRQRVIFEGSWEWRLLELFDELHGEY